VTGEPSQGCSLKGREDAALFSFSVTKWF